MNERQKQQIYAHRATRKAAGLCIWCGAERGKSLVYCDPHRIADSQKSKEWRKAHPITTEQAKKQADYQKAWRLKQKEKANG